MMYYGKGIDPINDKLCEKSFDWLKSNGIGHFTIKEETMNMHWCSFTLMKTMTEFYCNYAS